MHQLRQKRPRLKLSPEEYNLLRQQVLERDGWRCQDCGSSKHLHVHHQVNRSKLGNDALDNLITLCATCHQGNTIFVLRQQVRCELLIEAEKNSATKLLPEIPSIGPILAKLSSSRSSPHFRTKRQLCTDIAFGIENIQQC